MYHKAELYISQNASTVTSKPVNAMASPDPWEARATPAFALLDSVGDGSNTDPVPWLGSEPSRCPTGVGVEAAVAVSDGRYGTGVQVPFATGTGYSKHLSKYNGGGTF
jgi:hypothetical protein